MFSRNQSSLNRDYKPDYVALKTAGIRFRMIFSSFSQCVRDEMANIDAVAFAR
jgi:hypothetical protein